jgi:RNA polymerase sigma factor (sigma-70 family)
VAWRAEALRRAQQGDADALAEVVRELNPLLWQVARSQGLSADDAADVVQTAWLELVRHLRKIESPQAVTAWLVSVTRRESWRVRDRLRSRRHEGADALDDVADGHAAIPDVLAEADRHHVLWRHLQRLSERCRTLLRIIAFVDRPDYAAVSQALGMPRGSIGPTRGRCLAKLRELLLADPAWER